MTYFIKKVEKAVKKAVFERFKGSISAAVGFLTYLCTGFFPFAICWGSVPRPHLPRRTPFALGLRYSD